MKFTGKTGEVLRVQLPSKIISARWIGTASCINGTIDLEVRTHWVGDNSDISVHIRDIDGNDLEMIQGKVVRDIFRISYNIQANASSGIYFEAELSAHGLSQDSDVLKVYPPMELKNLNFVDNSGNTLDTIQDDEELIIQAEVPGPPDGFKGVFTLYEKYSEADRKMIFADKVKVKDGFVKAAWKPLLKKNVPQIQTYKSLNPDGMEYVQPSYQFELEFLKVKALSDEVPVVQRMILEYADQDGDSSAFAGKSIKVIDPTGEETSHTIPDDGKVVVEQSLPGVYSIDDSEIVES